MSEVCLGGMQGREEKRTRGSSRQSTYIIAIGAGSEDSAVTSKCQGHGT